MVDRYDIAVQSCIILKAGNDALDDQLAAHNETMDDLDRSRAIAADVADLAAAGKDCASATGAEDLITGATVGVCAFAAVEGAANVAANEYELQMSEAERSHEAEVQTLAGNIDEAICFNDAEIELVDARAALMRIKRAQQDQAKAIINLRGLKSYALGLFNEGHAAVAMEEARLERSLPSQFAVSEAAELFSHAHGLRPARDLPGRAGRGVRVPDQPRARQQVLAATRPDELEAALQTVIAFVATPTASTAPRRTSCTPCSACASTCSSSGTAPTTRRASWRSPRSTASACCSPRPAEQPSATPTAIDTSASSSRSRIQPARSRSAGATRRACRSWPTTTAPSACGR